MIASYLYFPHAVAVVYTAVFLSVAVHFRAHLSSPALDAFSLLDSVMNMCKNKVGGKLLPRYGLVSAVTQALFSKQTMMKATKHNTNTISQFITWCQLKRGNLWNIFWLCGLHAMEENNALRETKPSAYRSTCSWIKGGRKMMRYNHLIQMNVTTSETNSLYHTMADNPFQSQLCLYF